MERGRAAKDMALGAHGEERVMGRTDGHGADGVTKGLQDIQSDEGALATAKHTVRQIARNTPEPSELWGLLESHPAAHWRVIERAFIAEVHATPERKAGWVQALERVCIDAAANLADDVLGTSVSKLEGAILSWQREQDPLEVWERGIEVPLRGWVTQKTRMLLAIDVAAGLRVIEKMPYPGVIKNTLWFYIEDAPDSMTEVLRAAPLVFEGPGSWVKERNIGALAATSHIVSHAKRRYDGIEAGLRGWCEIEKKRASERLPGLRDDLLAWMRRAFKALMERPDGLHIAIAYMANLSHRVPEERVRKRYQKEPWIVSEAALEVLASVLRDRGIGISEARKVWNGVEARARAAKAVEASRNRVRTPSNQQSAYTGEGARTLYGKGWPVFTASLQLLSNEPSQGDLEAVASWLEELLVGRDPDLEMIPHREYTHEEWDRLGRLFSLLPSPDQLLRAIYTRLECQRRRGLFACRYDGPGDLESVILLRISLNGASAWAHKLRAEGKPITPGEDWYFWIYQQARRLWLTHRHEDLQEMKRRVSTVASFKRDVVTSCFAFMPIIFGEKLEWALKRALPFTVSDPRMLVEAGAYLRRNGVAPFDLFRGMSRAGADLQAALHEVQELWITSGEAEPFPECFSSMAEDLKHEAIKERTAIARAARKRLRRRRKLRVKLMAQRPRTGRAG